MVENREFIVRNELKGCKFAAAAKARANKEIQTGVVLEMPEKEFLRLTLKMFPRWGKADSRIARFMHNLDPKKIYTEREIKELCKQTGVNRVGQLMKYQGTVGHGIIIQLTSDKKYQLYPSLVDSFKRYF